MQNLGIFFDTETQGLPLWNDPSEDPRQPHIVQLAAALDDGDVVDADIFPDRPEEPAEAAATREDIFPAQPKDPK